MITLLSGDVIDQLKSLSAESVNCVVTSPPYFNLRRYTDDAREIGCESTPEEYVKHLVEVFVEVKRVLRSDGNVWLNLGDSYWNTNGYARATNGWHRKGRDGAGANDRKLPKHPDLKVKDLIGIPWMVAFALRSNGWWLRNDVIWSKNNAMPSSVTDRLANAHEHIFLLTKSPKYYFNADAIREPWTGGAAEAVAQGSKEVGKRGVNKASRRGLPEGQATQFRKGHSGYFGEDGKCLLDPRGKRRRDVWTIPSRSFNGKKYGSTDHFATFPIDLITPCIKAGCPPEGTVLDPFCGSGTAGVAAINNGRNFIGIDLNQAYLDLTKKRVEEETGKDE
jgi:site-specific DNA-methyltransferase (cytosine-N4-specific)